MPNWVKNVADKYMKKNRTIVDLVIEEKEKSCSTIRHIAIPTHWDLVGDTVNDVIAMFGSTGRVLIFCHTKADCDAVAMDKAVKHECQV